MALPNLPRNTYGHNVKHMECTFYFEPSGCRWSEAQCKYEHHPTGQRAEKPRRFPGIGSVAGGNVSRAQRCQRTRQPWRSGIGSQTASPKPQALIFDDNPKADSSPQVAGPLTLTPGTSPSINGHPPVRLLCARCRVSVPEGGFCPAPGCGPPLRQASGKEPLPSPPPPDKSDDEDEDDWNVGGPLTTPDWFEELVGSVMDP